MPVWLATSLDLEKMDDNGMYVWAGILTLVGLAASFGIAVWWRRWRNAQKE